MKVIEHLAKADRPLISFEIIPPMRGGDVKGLLALIDDLVKYRPPFIDITSHAAEVMYDETPQGIQRRVKYHIDAVPHILCRGFTREETEDFLIELKYLGIDNVLAVRGDDSGYQKPLQHGRSANVYACDLVRQIASMNHGKYLEQDLLDAEPSDFCVGVGGYPEKHFEAPNLKLDARHVKDKIEAGADYVVTQMFFDNQHYFRYLEVCRAEGIEAPIIPGLKILTSQKQLTTIPKNFFVEIPDALADAMLAAKPEHAVDVGVEWAFEQSRELLAKGAPSLHFYVMQSAAAIKKLMEKLKL
jgi:methylenetetrahydrofolate reductase (NADPH)